MDKIDLLAHKYHPERSDNFSCHLEQATRLKQWIQEFSCISSGQQQKQQQQQQRPYEYDDSYSESELTNDSLIRNVTNCVLLSGPPGVGKTSLVYTIANELKLHVIESHPSEKRDFKLFSMLKLTNQKGKINPIAKLFQAAKQQQHQEQHISTRIKRRKLAEAPTVNQPQLLSLKSDTSIILFDDIDVVFEEDGPFLKSLVEFIRESKRPVVLTATQSIDYIRQILVNCEHIHLDKPCIESCGKLLTKVCKQENYLKVNRNSRCLSIAEHLNCDIRQCLNTIHFYGCQADESLDNYLEDNYIAPEFSRLNLVSECKNDENRFILDCYTNYSLVDLIDSKLNLINRSNLLDNWLEGRPSIRNEEYKFEYDLGEQIRESIVEQTKRVLSSEMMQIDDFRKHKRRFRRKMDEFEIEVVQRINRKIKSRIEPPEKEFYVDIVPMFSELVELEAQKKITNQVEGISNGSRRSRRMPSYLDTIEVQPLEQDDIGIIHQGLLDPEDIDNVQRCF